jgi:hypothetical protein
MKFISWKSYILPLLIGFSALSVSASAAIYSVSGLAKLFAGASLQVMVMAGSLELAKLVTATLLHHYWKDLGKLLKVYLTTAVVVLVLITSMGIYGFLSAAYQQTAVQYETSSRGIDFLKQKEAFFAADLQRYDQELERISNTINELSKSRTVQYQINDANAPGGVRTAISTAELRSAENRLRVEDQNRTQTFEKRNQAADSLKSVQVQILNLQAENSSNSELGPLIYISGLTGRPMDEIVNVLLLVIIFVFDPLAIALVLAANFAFGQIRKDKPEEFTPIKIEVPKKQEEKAETPAPPVISVALPKVEEPPVETKEEVQILETTFDSDYTGIRFNDIVKILQKTPNNVYAVLLKDGRRINMRKDEYLKLKQEHESNTKTY